MNISTSRILNNIRLDWLDSIRYECGGGLQFVKARKKLIFFVIVMNYQRTNSKGQMKATNNLTVRTKRIMHLLQCWKFNKFRVADVTACSVTYYTRIEIVEQMYLKLDPLGKHFIIIFFVKMLWVPTSPT